MPIIDLKGFRGEIPRTEPHLLEANSAQLAKDCEFDRGSLAPVRNGFELATLQSNPARGFYTEEGTTFFSWPVEALVFPSPLNEDQFNRIYYLLPSVGTLMVANRTEMAPNGPTPAGVRAGLPGPTVKPVLTLRDRTTLPDYPTITITAESWWQNTEDQTIVNRAAAVVTPIQALRVYQIALPGSSGAPTARRMGAKLTFSDTSVSPAKEIFSISTYSGGAAGKSQAVPGTVEGTLQEDAAKGLMYLTWGVQETRAYTYTYENTWNEESSAAPPDIISPTYVQDVQIDTTAADFTGYRPYLKTRIYRTFGSVATYVETNVVQDGGVATRFYDSATKPDSAKSTLESTDYLPLGTGMEGIEAMPDGWFAAFKGNTLWMSETAKPHAWPYSSTFRTAIRGIRAAQQSLVVATTDGIYLIVGTPATNQQIKMNLPQPGIAQRSMIGIDGGVAYASNDGIPVVAGSSATMDVSQRLFTREVWRDRFDDVIGDASLMFGYHDGKLIAQSFTQAKGFSVRMDEDVGAFVRHEERYDALKYLPVADSLYYTIGNKLYQFRAAETFKTFDWWGRDNLFETGTNFGAGYISCDGPITLMLYGDGVLRLTRVLPGTGIFRLQDTNLYTRWSVRLQGASKVRQLVLAKSMKELKRAK